jgi:hypothetical protein
MSRHEALDLLGSAILINGAHPSDAIEENEEQALLLIRDARDELAIKETDNDPKSIARIQQRLSDNIDAVLFSPGDYDATRSRMADIGILPIGGYEIEINIRSEITAQIGSHIIRETIVSPDRVEELLPVMTETYRRPEQFHTMLYAKKVTPSNLNKWIVSFALKNAFTIKVMGSFVIDLGLISKPHDVLVSEWVEGFAQRYGVEFEFDKFGRSRYFHDLVIPFETAQDRFQNMVPRPGYIYHEMSGHNDEKTETYIIFMFIVDKTRYLKELGSTKITKKKNRF